MDPGPQGGVTSSEREIKHKVIKEDVAIFILKRPLFLYNAPRRRNRNDFTSTMNGQRIGLDFSEGVRAAERDDSL